MKTLVVLQPGYLPWLGFFDQMRRSRVFVYYDDVQFDKHGWRNRNRIKSSAGPYWLTVPVFHKGFGPQAILDVKIDHRISWARKQIGTIRQFYVRAPYLDCYLPELEEILSRRLDFLVDLDIAVTEWLCRMLGLEPEIYRSSELKIKGKRSERLLALCRHFEADHYLAGDAGKNYLDTHLFAQAGVHVEWQNYQHPCYRQQYGEFIPYLSILDLLLNEGEASLSILSDRQLMAKQ